MRIPPKHEEPDDTHLQAPPELVSALNRLPQERVFVPPTLDEAVVRAARQHLGDIKSGRTKLRGRFIQWLLGKPLSARSEIAPSHQWKILFAASAAVVVLALVVYQFFPPVKGRTFGVGNPFASRPVSERVPTPSPGNSSTERRLDIVDAFTLAKQLKAGPVREPRWDLNHDGVVDERDVRAIASEAVRLDKGGRS